MSDAAGLRCLSVIWSYLLAVERSLSFLPSREARCCSRASRRELGAWGGWGSADYNHGQVGKLGHLARFSLLSSLLISSLSHTHKAAAKFRHHPQIHYLLYDSSLFCFFVFFIWFHQVWLASMHMLALDHASESTAGLTGRDRAEHHRCGAPESKHNKHVCEPSNEPMQRPAVHKCSRKHTHLHTHTQKENHYPKFKS